MRSTQRPWYQLPIPLMVSLLLFLCLQIATHQQVATDAFDDYRPLTKPYDTAVYRGLSMGSTKLFSYLLAIRIQLHDNQAGRHFQYGLLDYDMLVQWFQRIDTINPASQYSMQLATRVYSQTANKNQLRTLLGYIDSSFERNPQLFWRNQAEATVIAKHRLEDLELALRMAEKLYLLPATVKMPAWARDMHFLLLADLNEYETSISIIQALLASNSIKDPDELRFLKQKLSDFQQKLFESQQKS